MTERDNREYIREPNGATTAVLMIHGICGTPRQFDFLIPLIPKDYAIYNILLSGHGGGVRDFSHTSMENWLKETDIRLCALYAKYDKIIVVGHSMGTLLLTSCAEKYADKIAMMIFLASPLKIFMKPKMIPTSLKIAFDKYDRENPYHVAMRRAYSIEPDGRLWRYLGWIPRYLELFSLSRKTRALIPNIKTPTYVFQSGQDELVSLSSAKYFENNENIRLYMLENSRHFDYSESDLGFMCGKISEIFDGLEKR